MGIDWEGLLGAEGAALADAYEASIPEDEFVHASDYDDDFDDFDLFGGDEYFAEPDGEQSGADAPVCPELPMSLNEFREILSGRKTPLRCYMLDERRVYSEYLTCLLADRLMEALYRHRQILADAAVEEAETLPFPPDPSQVRQRYQLTGEEVTFFRSFFYCALRLLGTDVPPWVDQLVDGTFGNLYDLVRDPRTTAYKTEQQLLAAQQNGNASGFFNLGDDVCRVLDYNWNDSHRTERWADSWRGATPAQDWADDFPQRGPFKANWYTCRQLYFQLTDNDDLRQFADDIEQALHIFLRQDGRKLL